MITDQQLLDELRQLEEGIPPKLCWEHLLLDAEPQPAERIDAERKCAIWRSRFGDRSPLAIHTGLAGNFIRAQKKSMTMYLSDEGEQAGEPKIVSLLYRTSDAIGQTGFQVKEPLDEANELDLSDFHVNSTRRGQTADQQGQGQGIATLALFHMSRMMRDQYPNLERMKIHAKMDGTYAWARLGFVPLKEEWLTLKKLLGFGIDKLERRLPASRDLQVSLEMIRMMIDNDDPISVRRFADVPIPNPDFDPDDPKTAPEEITVGKYILTNRSWLGEFILNDRKTAEFLEERATAVQARQLREAGRK